jgi:hypothetical protein
MCCQSHPPHDPVGGSLEHLDAVGPQIGGRLTGDPGDDLLAGQGVPHEDHSTVVGAADAGTTGGHGAHLELEQVGGLDHGRARIRPAPL